MPYRLEDLKRNLAGAPRGEAKRVPQLDANSAAEVRRRLDEAAGFLVEPDCHRRSTS